MQSEDAIWQGLLNTDERRNLPVQDLHEFIVAKFPLQALEHHQWQEILHLLQLEQIGHGSYVEIVARGRYILRPTRCDAAHVRGRRSRSG